ncbi:rhodanese-like domain-containing protein [Flavobacterium sp. 14A]|uniref:rhodanese-like domain-containing protein n=1 Tax=Flavobacterium sp. 14A TaxID=2735896 RepID=UPI0015707407|nr:rhodanese-like domain-containing protein [Flavobacterium sp. 14A]NRT11165.1 rhodanese-related sulfurtransferase [Flavobacterium sp. 14A]
MIALLKKILGFGAATNYKELMQQSAVIIDVRSPAEFKQGHIKGAVNMPLNEIVNQVSKIKKDRIIITCCASGMRSASAKNLLKNSGYEKVYNGGNWSSLERKI